MDDRDVIIDQLQKENSELRELVLQLEGNLRATGVKKEKWISQASILKTLKKPTFGASERVGFACVCFCNIFNRPYLANKP